MVVSRTLLIFLFTIAKIYCQNGTSVTVNTNRGPVVGFHYDQGNDTTKLYYGQADMFIGIPYVQPPIGQLRYAVSVDNIHFLIKLSYLRNRYQ